MLSSLPFLDGQENVDFAATVAVRSLIARGLLVADSDQKEPEGNLVTTGESAPERTFQAEMTLAGLIALRRQPSAILHLVRIVENQKTNLVYYLFPMNGVLEELVTADGYHEFSVPTRAMVPERVARYADQNQVASEEDGEAIVATIAELDQDPTIRDTRALTVMTVLGNDADELQASIMATSDGVFVMDQPQEGDAETEIREVSRATLLELISMAMPNPDKNSEGEAGGDSEDADEKDAKKRGN